LKQVVVLLLKGRWGLTSTIPAHRANAEFEGLGKVRAKSGFSTVISASLL